MRERERAKVHIIQDNFLDEDPFFLLHDNIVGHSQLTFNFDYARMKFFNKQKVLS